MTISRREYNKQQTIQHIRTVFLQMYARGGIDSISVSDLCKECGIAKSTFYLYYEDKFQVLESIEAELLETLSGINPDLNDCSMDDVLAGKPLQKALDTVCYIKKNAEAFRALLGKNGDPHFTYKWKKDIMASFIGRFREEKGDDSSAAIACTIFISSLLGLYNHFLFETPNVSEHQLSIIIGNLLKFSLFDFQAFAE